MIGGVILINNSTSLKQEKNNFNYQLIKIVLAKNYLKQFQPFILLQYEKKKEETYHASILHKF